jgi:hypothetical protein
LYPTTALFVTTGTLEKNRYQKTQKRTNGDRMIGIAKNRGIEEIFEKLRIVTENKQDGRIKKLSATSRAPLTKTNEIPKPFKGDSVLQVTLKSDNKVEILNKGEKKKSFFIFETEEDVNALEKILNIGLTN